MITINPYLDFNGNCEEAFEFYKSVFGVELSSVMRYTEMPTDPEHPLPEEMGQKIMYISLPISKETKLHGADTSEQFSGKAKFGNNISLMINAENKGEVDSLWAKLSVGGQVTMPLMDAFWGDYFGALTDKFGVNWMLICPSDKAE